MKKWKFRSMVILVLCLSLLMPSSAVRGEAADKAETSTEPEAADKAEASSESAAADGPDILAAAAAVLDMDTGKFIYEKNVTETQEPGDIAKLMTALLLAENCDLSAKAAFSEILYNLEEGSLKLGLQPGEEITLYDAACAVILGSADDVCNGIAEYVAGSPDAFAELMNERAEELGCVNTHFTSPHGLSGSYTCARDLALIARAAYGNEIIREICGLAEYTVPSTNLSEASRELLNSHQMLQYDSGYYQDWCTGGKESYTSQSLSTIVTFGSSAGRNFVSVIVGAEDSGEAYEETARLLTWGFDSPLAETEGTEETEKIIEETERITEETEEEKISEKPEDPQEEPLPAAESSEEVLLQTEADTEKHPAQKADINDVTDCLMFYLSEAKRIVSEYAENNFMVVFIIWCAILLLLFVLIVLLLLRCITDYRIRKKRKKAEKIWRQKEAQIEQMTVEELEAELRRRRDADRNRRESGPDQRSGRSDRKDRR